MRNFHILKENRGSRRIMALLLTVALVTSLLGGTMSAAANDNQSASALPRQNVLQEIITNNFDETDVTYNNKETWEHNAVSYEVRRGTNSEPCAMYAQYVEKTGINGTAAVKFWQICGSSGHDNAVSYVRLYDTAENGYRLFTPKANQKYTISLKIKAVVSNKLIDVQLRRAASDGTISYDDAAVAILVSGLEASGDSDWVELTTSFTTGNNVTPLYIVLKASDGWWADSAEVYVDDITVSTASAAIYTPSNEISNDFDETDVTYNNKETWEHNAESYEVRRGTNSEPCAMYAQYVEKMGINGTAAVKFWQICGSSGHDNAVSYVRLYDTAENGYRLFVPEVNAKYTVSLKIKVVKSSKLIDVQLRRAASDGTISYDDAAVATLVSGLEASGDSDWVELTTLFTTGNTVTPLYIVLKASDGWWADSAEVYVDDIVVKKKTYESSKKIKNTYDEDFAYTNTEDGDGGSKYVYRNIDNGTRLADFATIASNIGVEGSKAVSFNQIRGSSENDGCVSYVMLYETAENDYMLFTPRTMSKYNISLKIKALKCTKSIMVQLCSIGEDGAVSYADQVLAALTDNAIEASVDAEWIELKASFHTTDKVSPLYISLSAADGWWDETNPEVYVDDIEVSLVQSWDEDEPDEKNGIWTGKTASGIAQGEGTAENPYLITTGAELAYAVINNGENGKYYKLTKDIFLNDVSQADWYQKDTNNVWLEGTRTSAFNGHLDGAGHIVYGIWYPDDCDYIATGLIPTLSTGSVKNVGIRYAYINTQRYGGLAGLAVAGGVKDIDRCFADNTVRVYYRGGVENTGDSGIAGILGMTHTDYMSDIPQLNISNCYSKAALYHSQDGGKANGIIGYEWASLYTVKNCYSVGYAPFNGAQINRASRYYVDSDGNILRDANEVYENIYNDARTAWGFETFDKVELKNMIGEAAKTNMPGLDYNNIFFTVEGTTPMLKIFKSETFDGSDSEDGVNISGYESGRGTKDDPYIVKTAEQLKKLVEDENTAGNYYEFANDIYVNDTTDPAWMSKNPVEWAAWTGSVSFDGNLDGKGYAVHGLYMNGIPSEDESKMEGGGTALFPFTGADSVIRNVHLRDSYLSCSGIVGGIVCKPNPGDGNYAYIIGCSVDETVTLKGQTAGGIAGAGARGVRIVYCYSTADITATSEGRGNGIVGDIWGSDYAMVQCYTAGHLVYRGNYTPAVCQAVYGTESQTGVKQLTKAQMTGSAAKKNMTDLDWENVWYAEDGKSPQLRLITADMDVKFDDEGVVGRPWSGLTATKYAGGSGTENDPYLIETPEQLARAILTADGWTHFYYKLTADIKINDTSKEDWIKTARNWLTTSSVFSSYFNGNGHIVSGLYYHIEDGSALYAGLFPVVGVDAVIEKVGVVDSYLYNQNPEEEGGANAGAIAGFVSGWLRDDEYSNLATIRQCFAADSVTVEAKYAGGIVGGSAGPVVMENCYFTGTLIGKKYGALVGDSWQSQRHTISNCYAATPDSDSVVGNVGIYRTLYTNVYTSGSDPKTEGVTKLNLLLMQGKYALEYMEGFDFDKIWKSVEGGTPVLRVFGSDAYSSKRDPEKIKIEFVTNGGSECEPIYGYARIDKLGELPVPTKYGYKFVGWYHYAELDLPCTLEYFPDYDTHLYAKWEPAGFTVGFEGSYDEAYDYNAGVEHFAPGVSGYTKKYVYKNLKSMHCLGTEEEGSIFLLSYENKLEVGQEYEMSFWVYTEDENISGTMELVHTKYPDVNASTVGYEEAVKLDGMKEGIWKQYVVKFTANAPYLLIRTSAGADFYIDEMTVMATGEIGKTGKLLGMAVISSGGSIGLAVGIVCVAVVLIGGGTAAGILVYRKRKKVNK